MTAEDAETLKAAVSSAEDKRALERLARKSRGQESSPAALGEKFQVPWLSIRVNRQLELFEDQFREVPWRLSSCDAALTEREFSLQRAEERIANIDVDEKGKIGYTFMSDLQKELALLEIHGPQSDAELTVWLDQHIPHPDITQSEMTLFLGKMIHLLIEERGFGLEELISNRWRLRDAAEEAVSHHRRHIWTVDLPQVGL